MGFDVIKEQQSARDVPALVSQTASPYQFFQGSIILSLKKG